MALGVYKKERETPQSLVRRFTQRVQRSGILVRVKKNKFKKKIKSRPMQKRAALRKEELRKRYEKLKKLGEVQR